MTLLRPSALSRSVQYLCPTDLYSEGSSYRTTCVHTFTALRLCGEWADYLALRERGREETLTLNIYIITHLLGFVKRFFKSFLKNFWEVVTPCKLGLVLPRPLTYILYHKPSDLSRGEFRRPILFCSILSLNCVYIIPYSFRFVNTHI